MASAVCRSSGSSGNNWVDFFCLAPSIPLPVISGRSRRQVAQAPVCNRAGQKACPVYGYIWRQARLPSSTINSYDCVDILADLEYVELGVALGHFCLSECRSCGGCVAYSFEGQRDADGGRDCSAIPNVDSVRCQQGQCIIGAS